MPHIVGILLAGGGSRRFGSNKLAALANGMTPIGVRSAEHLQAAVNELLVVVPAGNTTTLELFDGLFDVSVCADSSEGIGRSIAHGVGARRNADGWLIGLADMPFIRVETIVSIANALSSAATIARPCLSGRAGHPVGFGAAYAQALMSLRGDVGAQQIVDAHSDSLVFIETDDAGVLIDIDRPEDIVANGDLKGIS
jgi:molybdenum cofactor cytidylyltransferase